MIKIVIVMVLEFILGYYLGRRHAAKKFRALLEHITESMEEYYENERID